MLELRNEKVAIPVVLLAGILWSFGPLVVRHIDQPELVPWQYLLGRGLSQEDIAMELIQADQYVLQPKVQKTTKYRLTKLQG